MTVKVRKWLADGDSHDDHGDQKHTIHAGVDEKRQRTVEEENIGDCAIKYGDTGLAEKHKYSRRGQVAVLRDSQH